MRVSFIFFPNPFGFSWLVRVHSFSFPHLPPPFHPSSPFYPSYSFASSLLLITLLHTHFWFDGRDVGFFVWRIRRWWTTEESPKERKERISIPDDASFRAFLRKSTRNFFNANPPTLSVLGEVGREGAKHDNPEGILGYPYFFLYFFLLLSVFGWFRVDQDVTSCDIGFLMSRYLLMTIVSHPFAILLPISCCTKSCSILVIRFACRMSNSHKPSHEPNAQQAAIALVSRVTTGSFPYCTYPLHE